MESSPSCLPARVGDAARRGRSPQEGYKNTVSEANTFLGEFSTENEILLQEYINYRDLLQGEPEIALKTGF